jgi:hypothetical protein
MGMGEHGEECRSGGKACISGMLQQVIMLPAVHHLKVSYLGKAAIVVSQDLGP